MGEIALGIQGIESPVAVGVGGFATVYRAYQPAFGRTVAVKVVTAADLDDEGRSRFERECRAMGAVSGHPAIVTLYDAGFTVDGRPYLIMAYMRAGTLRDRVRQRGPMPWGEVLEIGVKLASALETAHRVGIVHRDVKPANVLVSAYGEPELADFGIARMAGSGETSSGVVTASLAHAAPEIVDGGAPSAVSDVYSLGSTLYELLAGAPAFVRPGDDSVLQAVVRMQSEPVEPIVGVPDAVMGVVAGMMSKDPADRPDSALAAARVLQGAQRAGGVVVTDLLLDPGLLTDDTRSEVLSGVGSGSAENVTGTSVGGDSEGGDDRDRSVAVLPFEVVGRDEDAGFLADGLHNDLLTELTKAGHLTVIGRTSVMTYRGSGKPAREIASELGVEVVVEGVVQSAGQRVRLSIRLLDAGRGVELWADRFDRELTAENLFSIQTDLASRIVRSLHAELVEGGPRVAATDDLDAYRLVVEGRSQSDLRTGAGLTGAIDLFERAVEQDPDYALAWVGLADALTLAADYGHGPSAELLPRAKGAVYRALALDPDSPEAHTSLGLLYSNYRDGPGAIREFERAIDRSPGYAEAHNWLSWVALLVGRADAALESSRRAVELNPLSAEAVSNLAISRLAVGEAGQALIEARRSYDLSPSFTTARFYEGIVLYELERFEEAVAVLEPLSVAATGELLVPWAQMGPDATLAAALSAAGDTQRAQDILAAIDPSTHPFAHGLVLAALGETGRALAVFAGIDDVDEWPSLTLHHWHRTIWEPLAADPRYHHLRDVTYRSWRATPDDDHPLHDPDRAM